MSCLYNIFLFIVFLTSCDCQKNPNNNKIVTNDRIIINDLIDETILDIRSALKRFGFDPINVPMVQQNLSVKIPLFSKLTVQLNLTNGIINGASNFRRAENFYLYFLPSTVRLYGKVYIDRLYGTFNYSYTTRVYKDSGILDTTIKNVTAILQTDYRLDQFVILNPKFKIENIGTTKVDMKSQAKLRLIANTVINVALPFFSDKIANIADRIILQIVQQSIDCANKNMNSIVTQAILGTIKSLQGGYKK